MALWKIFLITHSFNFNLKLFWEVVYLVQSRLCLLTFDSLSAFRWKQNSTQQQQRMLKREPQFYQESDNERLTNIPNTYCHYLPFDGIEVFQLSAFIYPINYVKMLTALLGLCLFIHWFTQILISSSFKIYNE